MMYLVATDRIQAAKSRGEVLVFRRGYFPAHMQTSSDDDDEEKANTEKAARTIPLGEATGRMETTTAIHRQTKTFHWKDVCYDIKIKGNPRRLLDRVDGWVKPGTLTALMVHFYSRCLVLCEHLSVYRYAGCIGCGKDDAFGRPCRSCYDGCDQWEYVRRRLPTR
jgi:hypothetical protein